MTSRMETPSTALIHPTAVIHPSAQIGSSVEIGPYAVIGEEVTLQARVHVGPHAVVEFADVGEACRIHAGAFVGTAPQDLKYRGEKTRLTLGAGLRRARMHDAQPRHRGDRHDEDRRALPFHGLLACRS